MLNHKTDLLFCGYTRAPSKQQLPNFISPYNNVCTKNPYARANKKIYVFSTTFIRITRFSIGIHFAIDSPFTFFYAVHFQENVFHPYTVPSECKRTGKKILIEVNVFP